MRISIIIVAYRNYDVLKKCLCSLKEHNDFEKNIEIIVVDNTPEEEKQTTEISDIVNLVDKYISSENHGFGAGNNLGAKVASGEILAFINPDIIFVEPVFQHISNVFKSKNIGILGLKLLTGQNKVNYSFFFDFNTYYHRKKTIKIWNLLNYFDAKKMYTSGSNMFINKSLFDRIGGFDENIFMYFEELDLKKRMNKLDATLEFIFDSSKKLIHLDGSSTPNSVFSVQKEIESTIYVGKKHDLNYVKKLKFEKNYRSFKKFIFKVINKEEKVTDLDKQIQCYRKALDNLCS